MATINGTFNSLISGTLSGTVATPGATGPAGPTGPTGPAGAPGVGVPAGGTTGQFLSKSSNADYATGWTTLSLTGYATESWVTAGFYPLTGNPSGFITSSALTPYLLSSTAASTYQTIAGMSSYLTTSAAASTYAPIASPVFTGDARAVTPAFGDNDTSISTTAFVQSALLGGTAVARNLEVEVRNQSGSTIAAGSIVYISGATGNKPLITLAQANNDANSAQTIGFVKTAIANNGTGFVIVRGELENINTSALTEGVQLYLSPTTAGTWTTTKPSAPQHLVYVGVVIRSHPTLGTILVAVQNGYELGELHDVLITTPTNGQVLKYDSTTSLWKNQTDAVGAVTSVAGRTGAVTLSNTDISGLGTMATATATDYLSKAGDLAGLADTETARTNLGLGNMSTFDDAPGDGYTYGRVNGEWGTISSPTNNSQIGTTVTQDASSAIYVGGGSFPRNSIIRMTYAGDPTVYLENPGVFVTGDQVLFVNQTSGYITFIDDGSSTVLSPAGPYCVTTNGVVAAVYIGDATWVLSGNLQASI